MGSVGRVIHSIGNDATAMLKKKKKNSRFLRAKVHSFNIAAVSVAMGNFFMLAFNENKGD